MDALLYASLTRQNLSETLGGGNFAFPDLIAGGSAYIGLRFTHRRDGKERERVLDLVDVLAAVGSIDARPATGTTKIRLGSADPVDGENTTAELEIDELTAAGLVAAFSALSEVGSGDTWPTPTAVDRDGTIHLIFPGETEPVEISLVDNFLEPVSLLRVVTWEAGGEIVHALRFMQTPAAMSTDYDAIVPAAPTIVRHQAGGEIDGDQRTEVQILIRPFEFNGVFQIERDFVRSGMLSRADGPAQIKAALDPLADAKGFFEVTNPTAAEAFIYFKGSMDKTGHDLLTVHIARAPAADTWVKLDFSHGQFYDLLAAKDNTEVPIHFRVLYRDAVDEEVIHTADWIVSARAKRGLHWEGLETRKNLDFLTPPQNSYPPVAVGAIITGSQHLTDVAFPTSGDVGASQFTFTHDLESEDGHFAVRVNSTPGYKLAEGIDYRAYYLGEDQFRIDLLPGGLVFGTPVVNVGDPTKFNLKAGGTVAALGFLSLTYTTAGPRSALVAHTQAIATVDELPENLADIFARLLAVEGRLATGAARATTATTGGDFSTWEPEPVEVIYPLSKRRRASVTEWPARLKGLLDLKYRGRPLLRGRAGSLLPAVHDATPENISSLSPAFPALGNYVGRVFENNTAAALRVPGKAGRPTVEVPVGGFLACNDEAWYPVEKQESRTGANPFASSDYSSSSSEETLAVSESSWYPTQFVFDLFEFSVGAGALTDGRTFYFPFAFEAALFAANTKAQIVLEVQFGRRASATTPGTPGENLEEIEWSDPSLVHRLDLGGLPTVGVFGIRVKREASDTDSRGYVLTCEAESYGTADVVAPPLEAEFWICGRLRNFDTVDAPASPEGVLCISGLTMPAGYAAAIPSEGKVGVATVSE